MLIVSDTSPVRALASIGRLQLLPQLYREIIVPPAVAGELERPPSGQAVVRVADHTFLSVRAPVTIVDAVRGLDVGEAEAISLALELRPELLLIDERAGYAIAMRLGISVSGLLGVLLDAKDRGHLPLIKPVIDDLRAKARFFLSDTVVNMVLSRAAE